MRELVGGKNTIGRTAALLKSPIKRPLPLPSRPHGTATIGRIFLKFYTWGLLKSLENIQVLFQIGQKQERQCTYKLTFRRVRATTVAVETQ